MSFRGNILYTKNQEEILRARFSSQNKTIPSILTGFNNDVGYIKRGALEFIKDSGLGAGNDSAGWYPTSNMVINGDANNQFQPFGANYGLPRKLHNIHCAAVLAFVENNEYYAIQVLKELNFLSQISFLDFGNTVVFDRTLRNYANPVFMVASKMNQYLNSYSLIYELIKNKVGSDTIISNLETWFNNAADYFLAIIDNNQDYWYLNVDWRTLSGITQRSSPLQNLHTHYDSTGTIGTNEIGDAQVNTFNNRAWNLVEYIGLYGILYDESTYTDFHYDYFKMDIQAGMFPDGTDIEHFRSDSYNGGIIPNIRSGIDYVSERLYAKISGAYIHEVAIEKGFIPVSEKGKYFDYTTGLGTDELFVNHSYDTTSGGQKNLSIAIKNLSKYYRLPSDGGFQGQRFNTNGVAFNPIDQTFSLIAAKANTYFRDKEIEDFSLFNTDVGYPIKNRGSLAFNAILPSSIGLGIGKGASEGGLVPFLSTKDIFTRLNTTTSGTVLPTGSLGDKLFHNGTEFVKVTPIEDEQTGLTTSTLTLPSTPIDSVTIVFYKNGNRQSPNTYTVSGTTLTLEAGEPNFTTSDILTTTYKIA